MVVIVEDDVGRVTDARIKAVSGEDDLGGRSHTLAGSSSLRKLHWGQVSLLFWVKS